MSAALSSCDARSAPDLDGVVYEVLLALSERAREFLLSLFIGAGAFFGAVADLGTGVGAGGRATPLLAPLAGNDRRGDLPGGCWNLHRAGRLSYHGRIGGVGFLGVVEGAHPPEFDEAIGFQESL